MNWAAGYLIKSAIEKRAKRWFWRLAQLPPKRRMKAVNQLYKHINATGGHPSNMTWEDLANFGRSGWDMNIAGREMRETNRLMKKVREYVKAKGGNPYSVSHEPGPWPKQMTNLYYGVTPVGHRARVSTPASNIPQHAYRVQLVLP